jgi:hypothetical protein
MNKGLHDGLVCELWHGKSPHWLSVLRRRKTVVLVLVLLVVDVV